MGPTSPFCRVTVLAPQRIIDLALPTDLPVAELVPMLAELAGESPGRHPGRPFAWCLAAAAGAALPAEATLSALGVLDGDLLRLRKDVDAPPPPIFDDPVDAVARAGADSPPADRPLSIRTWTPRHTRAAGAAVTVPAVLAATAMLAAIRGGDPLPSPTAAVLAGLAAVAALVAAGGVSRRGVGAAPAAALGLAAVPLAAVTAPLALPGTPGSGHLLFAMLLGGSAAAVALWLLAVGVAAFVSVITVCALTSGAVLAGGIAAGSSATSGLAAGAAAAAMAVVPLLPRLSVRLAGLPRPVVPGDAAELMSTDPGRAMPPPELERRTRLAHDYLAGLVGGTCAVTAGGAILAALGGGWAGPTFAVLAAAVLAMRARNYLSMAPVLALLGSSLSTSGAVVYVAGTSLDADARLLVALGLLGIAAALLAGSIATNRRASPVLRRTLDAAEAVLVASAFPIALAALDLYRAVRSS